MALNYVTITGTFDDGTGAALTGTVTFTPSETVYSAGVPLVSATNPIVATVVAGALKSPSGGTLQLLATDNAGLTLEGLTGFWFWTVSVNVAGTGQGWSFFLPHSPSTVDLYALAGTPAGGLVLPVPLVPNVFALTDAATITVDASKGNAFTVTLGGNRTLANPAAGQTVRFHVTQDGSGSRTLSYGSAYDFGSAGSPTLTTTSGKMDVLGFAYDGSLTKWVYLGSGLGF